ncbi:MAG: hypothetical protein IT436_11280 [Phycisphaerales bacterium]|nr:hypothetical protein [Phycisphaerales bacterium]
MATFIRLRRVRSLVLLAVLGGVTAIAAGQQKTILRPVAMEGDTVPGVGRITRIQGVQVSDSGGYLILADTDADPVADEVLLTPGGVVLREGQVMADPAGATIRSIYTFAMSPAGSTTWALDLAGTGSLATRHAVYRDGVLIRQSGTEPATPPTFPPGTQYVTFFDTLINARGEVLTRSHVDPGDGSDPFMIALVLFSVDAEGAVAERAIIDTSQRLHQTREVEALSSRPHRFAAVSGGGEVLFTVDVSGWGLSDTMLYRWQNSRLTQLLREGDPAPVPGRFIGDLLDRPLDMNTAGDWVVRAQLDGDALHDDQFILKSDDSMTARERGPVPSSIGPYEFTSLGSEYGPVEIDDAGRVVYFGQWADPDPSRDAGLFRDKRLIMRKGVTFVDQRAVLRIGDGRQQFVASGNGRFVLASVALEDGTADGLAAAVMVEFCRADLNEDGQVDFADYLEFLNLYDAGSAGADFNGDGLVDFVDYLEFLGAYDAGC